MNSSLTTEQSPEQQPDVAAWKQIVAEYQKSSTPRALWQVANTFIPYIALWVMMFYAVQVSWWLAVPLAVLAAGFLVRIFIIFHDCGHGSFFSSQKANHFLGFVSGILTFTPYFHWRWEHSIHHATSGDLDRRGTGDVWTMTVEEYLQSSRWKRFSYRLARNPIILFGLAPLYLFLIQHRIPASKANKRERHSVYSMNLAIAALMTAMCLVFGAKQFLILQLIVIALAGTAGIWLFYVQHQFEGVYWERQENWDYTTAALQGSSFYKLPKVLQWFSGNIGYHHLHHLSSRIPNYNLQRCHEAHPLFQKVKPVTLLASFKSFSFRLWDERERKLVGYSHLRQFRRTA